MGWNEHRLLCKNEKMLIFAVVGICVKISPYTHHLTILVTTIAYNSPCLPLNQSMSLEIMFLFNSNFDLLRSSFLSTGCCRAGKDLCIIFGVIVKRGYSFSNIEQEFQIASPQMNQNYVLNQRSQ